MADSSLEVHLLTWNEEDILPFTLRHYRSLTTRIVLHDGGSTDRTCEIAEAAGCEVLRTPRAELDDATHAAIKSTAWRGRGADWYVMADADELIYFPRPMREMLREFEAQQTAIVKPHGWELFSETWPRLDDPRQIYEQIPYGAPVREFAKPILFHADRVAAIRFGPGAHVVEEAWLTTGERLTRRPRRFTVPAVHLFHCRHLGGPRRVSLRYRRNQERLSAWNRERALGVLTREPLEFARKKQRMLQRLLERLPLAAASSEQRSNFS